METIKCPILNSQDWNADISRFGGWHIPVYRNVPSAFNSFIKQDIIFFLVLKLFVRTDTIPLFKVFRG